MPRRGWSGCVICKGRTGGSRPSAGSRRCSTDACKKAYANRLNEQATEGLVAAAVDAVSDELPDGMWVNEIEEILGERCCRLHLLNAKQRKNGPAKLYKQEFLVRGNFLTEGEDDSDEEEDAYPVPDTYWVDYETLISGTVTKGDVKRALVARHERVLGDL